MHKRTRPSFSPEFRLETAQLVIDHGASIRETADAMGVGKSAMNKVGTAAALRAHRQVVSKHTNDTRLATYPRARKAAQEGRRRKINIKKGYRSIDLGLDKRNQREPHSITGLRSL